jgi:tellurite resistance protein TerC
MEITWLWAGFAAIVLSLLWVDITFVGGKRHKVSMREAMIWSLIWFAVAMAFNVGVWAWFDATMSRDTANAKALEFLTSYLIEKALAIDNAFVWLMIFSFFAIPSEWQRRVLLYGVLGAIVLRAIMVFGGIWLVNQFHWILYLFGAFLVFTGARMLLNRAKEPDLASNPVLPWLCSKMRLTEQLEGGRFFVLRQGVWYATPLFLVLILVEISDVIFAVDSIPAIFAITTDPFVILTSNIFAIMGLRAMYFLLQGAAEKFSLLRYGLGIILVFIGFKLLLIDLIHLPVWVTLGVVAAILTCSIVASLWVAPSKHND